jgi:predicted PurR-regulated permease PerM
MADVRRTFDIAPAAIVKVLAAIVIVWLWLHLWQLLMLVVVSVVLAIALDPIVEWCCARRIPRSVAAAALVALLAALIIGFFWITGESLAGEARMLGTRLTDAEQTVIRHLPAVLGRQIRERYGVTPDASLIANYALAAGKLLTSAIIVGVLALIVTIYLLIEGRRTYDWLIAYVPPRHRERAHVTAHEAQERILGYVIGNIATSAFATAFVYVALTLLHVPAALLLAILAGVFDFVPVLGFIFSSVPAVLLALVVSPGVALIVAAVYVSYHLIENYYIAPKVYGGRLRLSNLAVILAFAVGAEIGGIVGALLALPLAAMYPVVESVWLKDYLGRDAVETHRRIERRRA